MSRRVVLRTPAPVAVGLNGREGPAVVDDMMTVVNGVRGEGADEATALPSLGDILGEAEDPIFELDEELAEEDDDILGVEPADDDEEEELDPSVIANSAVDPRIVALLAEKGITKFTPIQEQSFDLLRSGADMLGRSQTGTGKTLAFALPLVHRLAEERGGRKERGRKAAILVLAPTRELARQVAETFELIAKPDRLRVETFHGGVAYGPQCRALRDGLDVLVGTPGRIIDHINNGDLDLSGVQYAVLDEADEMLNMGFKAAPPLQRAACPAGAARPIRLPGRSTARATPMHPRAPPGQCWKPAVAWAAPSVQPKVERAPLRPAGRRRDHPGRGDARGAADGALLGDAPAVGAVRGAAAPQGPGDGRCGRARRVRGRDDRQAPRDPLADEPLGQGRHARRRHRRARQRD